MRSCTGLLPFAIAVVMLGASVAPCALGGTAGAAQLRVAAGAAGHPPDCHGASAPELAAPCPCGCRDDVPASPIARLGFALPAAQSVLSPRLTLPIVPSALRRATDAPTFAIDHIPLVG